MRSGVTRGMQPPRIDPVGVLEPSPRFTETPRPRSARMRAVSAGVVFAFVAVIGTTSALSAGGFCVTSDAPGRSPLYTPR